MAGDFRSASQHDCDRIIYSSWYRRLAGVTQVVAVRETPLFHNRLTHTMKVAQLSRRLASNLNQDPAYAEALRALGRRVDEDAAEASALAHDLGHPPFGHIGEAALREACDEAGVDGYEGNAQSFRIVTRLAQRTGDKAGLSLSGRTLDGVLKYPRLRGPEPPDDSRATAEERYRRMKWGAYDTEAALLQEIRPIGTDEDQSVEAAIMDWCDDISYALHDVEDFYQADLIPLDRFRQAESEESEFFLFRALPELGKLPRFKDDAGRKAWKAVVGLFPRERFRGTNDDRKWLHERTSKFITEYFAATALTPDPPYIDINDDVWHQVQMLKQLTWQYVINSPALASLQQGQAHIIKGLFKELIEWMEKEEHNRTEHRVPVRLSQMYKAVLEDRAQMSILQSSSEAARARSVADYIASLTEDQAIDMYSRLFGLASKSVLEAWVSL